MVPAASAHDNAAGAAVGAGSAATRRGRAAEPLTWRSCPGLQAECVRAMSRGHAVRTSDVLVEMLRLFEQH